MNLRNIYESQQALSELQELKLPAVTAYAVKKLMAVIVQEMKDFQELKDKRFGEMPKSEDNPNKLTDEATKEFEKEFLELLEKEIDFNVPLITVESLGSSEVSSTFFSQLEWLIDG